MSPRLLPPLALALLLGGCRRVEDAPEDVDGLLHFLWRHAEQGEGTQLTEAVTNLHAAVDADVFTVVVEGSVSDLALDETEPFGRDVDPTDATGVFIVNRIPCTPAALEAILVHTAQDELRPGTYDSYDRVMADPPAPFLAGDSDRLGWDTTFAVSGFGIAYTASSRSGLRRVSEQPLDEGAPLVLRSHLLEDAAFDNPDSNNFIRQNYQLEAYWPHDGEMMHLYATWADTQMIGFEDEGEQSQRIQLNNLTDWSVETGELCAAGLP
ncbi:MAG: hypothetical protein EP330_11250 [Deltaproteobacteria bacterium]|nr:MAG: hypothetical protein EP330_11250 [Deltaproteobacteria bacterium]